MLKEKFLNFFSYLSKLFNFFEETFFNVLFFNNNNFFSIIINVGLYNMVCGKENYENKLLFNL